MGVGEGPLIERPADVLNTESGEPRWSDTAGFTVWSCFDLEGNRIMAEPGAIESGQPESRSNGCDPRNSMRGSMSSQDREGSQDSP
jgi:hypothetical protein